MESSYSLTYGILSLIKLLVIMKCSCVILQFCSNFSNMFISFSDFLNFFFMFICLFICLALPFSQKF